jgi:two-component system CheB/CheR fusion protein
VTLKPDDDGCGRLEVVDTGRGIDSLFLPRVFEMFQQAEAVQTRRGGGLGIGLALVRHIVQLHGGRVEAASDGLDKGSRFSVWLPLREATRELETGGMPMAKLPQGLRALVVDDDAPGADLLRDLLQGEGAVVTVAHSGQQALESVEHETFDIVACDIAMPGMDGYELVDALRKHPRTGHLPIVAITGFGRSRDVKRALKAGYDGHLAKPVTLEKITTLFASALAARAEPAA